MNKEQRRKIYEKALWCIGDDNEEFVCWILTNICEPWSQFLRCDLFPEFMSQQPRNKPHGWWPHTPDGNAKRRIALEKAIALTYKD